MQSISLYYKIIGGKQMKKISKQMSMEISGGHTVVAYPRKDLIMNMRQANQELLGG